MTEVAQRHIQACQGFSRVIANAGGQWERPTPCTEWDARGVVEHVIGFHDALVLKPLGVKPHRADKEDPVARWGVTRAALAAAIQREPADPASGDSGAPVVDLERLLPILTADVLVHTWDLARAVDVDAELDAGLCEISYEVVRPNEQQLRDSGMFAAPVPVPDDADPATKLVSFLGRDPAWAAP